MPYVKSFLWCFIFDIVVVGLSLFLLVSARKTVGTACWKFSNTICISICLSGFCVQRVILLIYCPLTRCFKRDVLEHMFEYIYCSVIRTSTLLSCSLLNSSSYRTIIPCSVSTKINISIVCIISNHQNVTGSITAKYT